MKNVSMLILIVILLFSCFYFLIYMGENFNKLSEIHAVILWNTNKKIKHKARKIIKKNKAQIVLEKDIHLHNKHLHMSSGGKDTNHPFTLFILKIYNSKYVWKKTHAALQLVNDKMFTIKSEIRGDYSNFKICHGSFNPEETREILESLNYQSYLSRYSYKSFNDLVNALNFYKVNYVLERSFTENDIDASLQSINDVDIITDNYYLFKNVTGGINKHPKRMEKDNGYYIRNKVKINNKEISFDIRSVGDNYYPNDWMLDILKNKKKYKNKYGTFYIPCEKDQLWMLYYHVYIQHPHRNKKNSRHLKTIKELEKKTGINATRQNFDKFIKRNGYTITPPKDKNVHIEYFNMRNHGQYTDTIQKKNGVYIKKFKNKIGYTSEKNSYSRLKNNTHFPSLIRYDDKNLTLVLSDVGRDIKSNERIPNFKKQINDMKYALHKNKIKQNDFHKGNLKVKNGVLSLIDFEYAEDLKKNKEWDGGRKNKNIDGCDDIPSPDSFNSFGEYLKENKCLLA